MKTNNNFPIVIGITGASGSILARSLIDHLLKMDFSVIATSSPAARMVWREEICESFGEALERWMDNGQFTYHAIGDLAAPIASGTIQTLGMAIVPCSMSTIAAIAHGLTDNLLRRAADVSLKERRPLVLVPRESPLNAIHLDNMASLARLGVTILPPEPAFYLGHKSVIQVVNFMVQRTMMALGLIDSLPKEMQYTRHS